MVTQAPRHATQSRSLTERTPQGVLITPLFQAIAHLLWQHRQLSKQHITQGFYQHVAHKPGAWECSLIGRDLRKWVAAGLLLARPQPIERANGRPPLVYCLGREACPVVSRLLDIPLATVQERQKQDSTLSWLFYLHRSTTVAVRLALQQACVEAGFGLTWLADEELARRKLSAKVDGKARPVRPDGMVVIDTPSGKAPRFLEIQLTSEPRAYRLKAEAYIAFYQSGAYTETFGFTSMRVLAVTDSPKRAANLQAVVATLPHPELFWSTTIEDVTTPFGAIWLVPGSSTRLSLLGT